MPKKVIDNNSVKAKLKRYIEENLSEVIDGNYVLWDIPYYSNIGDILIWEGTLEILKKIPYRCLQQASKETCTFPKLSEKIVIILAGGGNFGDIYPIHQEFRKKVIEKYPRNKIVILPQSVWYRSHKLLASDIEILKNHQNLTIFVRDEYSYNLLEPKLEDKIQLLPDMAFGIERKWKNNKKSPNKILFLKRIDAELSKDTPIKYIESQNVEVRDWPTFESSPFFQKIMSAFVKLSESTQIVIIKKITDLYGRFVYRPIMVKLGFGFLIKYKKIYTTRLHVLILGLILNKEILYIDNITGKLSAFSKTWLSDVTSVNPFNYILNEKSDDFISSL